MTKEKFNEIKNSHLQAMRDILQITGQVVPQVNVFGTYEGFPDETANIVFGVHPKFLSSEEAKQAFIDKVLPQIGKMMKEEQNFIIEAVAWSSEAWQRSFPADQGIPKDWKNTPIEKEVLMINLQTKDEKEIYIYEIKRTGKQVNGEGDLVDLIELTTQREGAAPENRGKFSNLFERITQF